MISYLHKEVRPINHQLQIRLTGPRAVGARADASALRNLLSILIDGAQGALRLRLEGRSRSRGMVPAWLQRAAAFEVLGFGTGSTVVTLEAPAVSEVEPEILAREQIFHDFDPDLSSLQLFEESLEEALNGRSESDLFDQPLLDVILDFRRILGSGVDRIELDGQFRPGSVVHLDADRLRCVERLQRLTPPDQRVRISGQLDTIRHSDRMFTLILDDGQSLRGLAEGVATRELAALFGRRAVVSGKAVFRPSGSVLRIEIDHLEPAGSGSDLWSQMPHPALGRAERRPAIRSQGPRSGVSKIFGQWPGDESEAEVRQALEALS